MKIKLYSLAAAFLLATGNCYALNQAACFSAAAGHFNLDKTLLVAISKWESTFNPKAINKNNDGTEDYGMMQINSSHLPALEQAGFTKKDLFDPCTNIYIGAYILNDCIKRHGHTWRAVGAYNAGSRKNREAARIRYVAHIKTMYQKLKGKS